MPIGPLFVEGLKLKKFLCGKIHHGNLLCFEIVFSCFIKKRRFKHIIHGYSGPIQNLGFRIYQQWEKVLTVHESLIEVVVSLQEMS
jgi:hypothetical protein